MVKGSRTGFTVRQAIAREYIVRGLRQGAVIYVPKCLTGRIVKLKLKGRVKEKSVWDEDERKE